VVHYLHVTKFACAYIRFPRHVSRTPSLSFRTTTPHPNAPQHSSEYGIDNLHDMAESLPILQKPGGRALEAENDVTSPKRLTLMGLPGELFQEIVAEMVITVKVRGTTNLRLVNSTRAPNFQLVNCRSSQQRHSITWLSSLCSKGDLSRRSTFLMAAAGSVKFPAPCLRGS